MLTRIGQSIGVTKQEADCLAVTFVSKNVRRRVQQIQELLQQRLGGAVWLMPLDCLHITLCEIIQSKEYIESKETLFKNLDHYQKVIEDVLPSAPIKVRFDRIECSPDAIIVRGYDDGTYNLIRSELVQRLPLPKETKQPPDIIHSTICRFAKEIEIEEVQKAISALSVDITEVVATVQLITHSAPHLVTYHIAQSYSLHKPTN